MWWGLAVILVFIGCCTNVVFLELIIKECPGSGNLITFFNFLSLTLDGLIRTTRFMQRRRIIPLKYYFTLVLMFFIVQTINNFVFNFNISMPLQMIFRSGSIMASLVLGVIILKRKYSMAQYISVVLITAGISMCSIASANDSKKHSPNQTFSELQPTVKWAVGLGMLVSGLFLSARMGIYQEVLYKEFGKHPNESLFYNHALPLPLFAILAKDIYQQSVLFNESEVLVVNGISLLLPKMWIYLLGNVITQYLCIRAVFVLTTECTALQVTLVVTLRKFVSLLFSIAYFRNPFTLFHWIGTVLVFGGTLLFTGVIPRLLASFSPPKRD